MGKDKNAPKKPLTGFFRYTATIRAEVEAETGLKGIKNAKIFSERWKALGDEEKQKFNAVFKTEMVEYKLKMAAYKETEEFAEFKRNQAFKKTKKKAPKDKNAPKRALSAFFVFSNEKRPEAKESLGGSNSIAQIGKLLGTWWKEVSVEDKARYQAVADKDKERYKTELEEYKKTEDYANHQKKLEAFKIQKKKDLKEWNAKKRKEEKAAQKAAAAAEEDNQMSSGDEEEDEDESQEEESN